MMKYVYMDESGDLGQFGSKYFIVAAIIVDKPIELSRIIKKTRQKKLKKKIKELPELKANNSDRRIREYVLRGVRNADCSIIAIAVGKDSIAKHLFEVTEKLYNYLCGLLIRKLPIDDGKVVITIDKKYTNSLLRDNFNKYLLHELADKKKIRVEIHQKVSQVSSELQVVDFVAWSISRKFNAEDDHYFDIIQDKILNKEKIRWG